MKAPAYPAACQTGHEPSAMTKNYLEAAIEIAQEAGKILREEFARPPHIAYKGDADLVTQADQRSERAIVERLTKYFPDHAIAAEEGRSGPSRPIVSTGVLPCETGSSLISKRPDFSRK